MRVPTRWRRPRGCSVLDRQGVSAHVVSPATVANVGPGFDSFGLCLRMHDSVTAKVTDHGIRVDIVGEAAEDLPRGESHLVVRSIRAALAELGVAQPGLTLRCQNRIPHSRGLGSSAAAIVSGIRLAERLAGRDLAQAQVLELATRLEGHSDNVAACLLGGFTIAWSEAGRVCALRLDVHDQIRAVVFVPGQTLSTTTARQLLPTAVKHAHASDNSARTGLLVAALTQRPEYLHPATQDRLHQDQRRTALPDSLALLEAMRAEGLAAVLSGAGPSVLVLGTASEPIDTERWTWPGWRSVVVSIDTRGARATAEVAQG